MDFHLDRLSLIPRNSLYQSNQMFYLPASMDSIEQVKGVGLVPKQALDVMNAEVNRILLLTKSAVIPIPYQVPRKVRGCKISMTVFLI